MKFCAPALIKGYHGTNHVSVFLIKAFHFNLAALQLCSKKGLDDVCGNGEGLAGEKGLEANTQQYYWKEVLIFWNNSVPGTDSAVLVSLPKTNGNNCEG